MESQNILVVGGGTRSLERVIPLLARSAFILHHAATGEEAVERLRRTAFDLLIVRHPVVKMGLDRLVGEVREPSSPSFAAALLLLAEEGAEREVGRFLGKGKTRVLSVDAPAERILATVAELLAAVPRGEVRVELSVSLRWHGDEGPIPGETVNVSRNGLLVRAVAVPPLGSAIGFEIDLPGRSGRCRGVGEVVRRGDTDRGGGGEFALRIVELDAVSQALFGDLLDPN